MKNKMRVLSISIFVFLSNVLFGQEVVGFSLETKKIGAYPLRDSQKKIESIEIDGKKIPNVSFEQQDPKVGIFEVKLVYREVTYLMGIALKKESLLEFEKDLEKFDRSESIAVISLIEGEQEKIAVSWRVSEKKVFTQIVSIEGEHVKSSLADKWISLRSNSPLSGQKGIIKYDSKRKSYFWDEEK